MISTATTSAKSSAADPAARAAKHLAHAVGISPDIPQHDAGVKLQRKCMCAATGESCARCKRNEPLQRAASGVRSLDVIPAAVHEVIASSGAALDTATRARMEAHFGHDFSSVRIHSGPSAVKSADAVSARAYTVGRHIVMGAGAPNHGSSAGTRLLAHELAHVVQQERGGVPAGIDGDSQLERDADRAATEVMAGRSAEVSGRSGPRLSREATTGTQQVYYEVPFADGPRRVTAAEYESMKARALQRLRARLKLVVDLADVGRQSQIDMLEDYHGGVESLGDVIRKPKSLIGITADIWGKTAPPYIGVWSHPKRMAERGIEAVNRGDLRVAANQLSFANQSYRDAMHEWNTYREKTIGGAESLASDLEVVRDVSFAVALAAGAAIAAPVAASGAAALGATGTTATVLTAGGTAVATGMGGAVLGGGSTALGSYASEGKVNWKDAERDAIKLAKQGAVTGLTAGLGTALYAAGKAGQLAAPAVQQALRRCLKEAFINVTGEITAQALDRIAPTESAQQKAEAESKALLPGPARAALVGCVGGALGVPTSKLRSGTAKAADVAAGATVSFVDAKLQGKTNEEALLAAVQSSATSHAVGMGKKGSDATAARRAAAKSTSQTSAEPASHAAASTSPAAGTTHQSDSPAAPATPAHAPKPPAVKAKAVSPQPGKSARRSSRAREVSDLEPPPFATREQRARLENVVDHAGKLTGAAPKLDELNAYLRQAKSRAELAAMISHMETQIADKLEIATSFGKTGGFAAAPEGTRDVGATTKPRTSRVSHERALGAAMEAEIGAIPLDHDRHHVAPKAGGGALGRRIRKLLRTAGVSADDAANGVPLAGQARDPRALHESDGSHSRVHTKWRLRELLRDLETVRGDPEGTKAVLRKHAHDAYENRTTMSADGEFRMGGDFDESEDGDD